MNGINITTALREWDETRNGNGRNETAAGATSVGAREDKGAGQECDCKAVPCKSLITTNMDHTHKQITTLTQWSGNRTV